MILIYASLFLGFSCKGYPEKITSNVKHGKSQYTNPLHFKNVSVVTAHFNAIFKSLEFLCIRYFSTCDFTEREVCFKAALNLTSE